MKGHQFKETLNACIIAKNEEKMLPLTLPNLVKGTDRVIIVDTGSNDGTKKIAAEMGADVYDFEWKNDFAAARNFSINKADSAWIMWIDADEYVEDQELLDLRKFLDNTDVDRIYVRINECRIFGKKARMFFLSDRVFRNGMGYKFEKRINEQLTAPEGAMGKSKAFPFNIYHWGGDLPAEELNKKNRIRLKMYEEMLNNDPEDIQCIIMAAQKSFSLGDDAHGLEYLYRAIGIANRKPDLNNYKSVVLAWLGWYFLKKKDYAEAIRNAKEAYELDKEMVEPYCIIAASYVSQRDFEGAMNWIEPAMMLRKKIHPIMGYNDYHWDVSRYSSYARCLAQFGRYQEALDAYNKVLEALPGDEKVKKAVEIIERRLKTQKNNT